MEITEIKQIGKSENYKIFLNNVFCCCLTLETIVKNKICKGTSISREELETLQFESEKITAFEKASNYLSRGLKTEFEIKKYLKTKGYFDEIVDYVCKKLKGYNYLDDSAFAQEYIRTYSSQKGRKALEFALIQKGIDRKIINETLNQLNNSEACLNMAEKYMKNKEKNQKNKQSLYRYLLSKGFDYDETASVVYRLFKGD